MKKINVSMNESAEGVVCTITVQADKLQELLPLADSVITALEREDRNREREYNRENQKNFWYE